MKPGLKGPLNPAWKGGRILAPNGYVRVLVGAGHHLADSHGYAYEHRVVAEKAIGRRLLPGEIVHHVNGVKTDNRPENLEVLPSTAAHLAKHRRRECDRRLPGEPNPTVTCACGCGESFSRFDNCGRPRRFVTGHNSTPKYKLGAAK